MEKKMRNEQGDVNAENIGGTYDHNYELNKKIKSHKTVSKEEQAKEMLSRQSKVEIEEREKVSGVHAENTGGTAREKDWRDSKS